MTRRSSQASALIQAKEPQSFTAQSVQTDTYEPATMLFVDMIGFTQFCAANDPATVGGVLREFLTLLGDTVLAHGGCVEKYLGDGLMAFFEGSQLRSLDATKALRCALAMTKAIAIWNESHGRQKSEAIQIAICIHTGRVIIGAVGSDSRREMAVFGDTVNIASRVEGKCRCLDAAILVTSQVKEKLCLEGSVSMLAGFVNFGFQELRGRAGHVYLHGLPRFFEHYGAGASGLEI